jgi:hypothetical protein
MEGQRIEEPATSTPYRAGEQGEPTALAAP